MTAIAAKFHLSWGLRLVQVWCSVLFNINSNLNFMDNMNNRRSRLMFLLL
jgi:hypothetical protein